MHAARQIRPPPTGGTRRIAPRLPASSRSPPTGGRTPPQLDTGTAAVFFCAPYAEKCRPSIAPCELRSAIVIACGAIHGGNLDSACPWSFGGLRPPAHPSTHRLGPLRGRLGPQPKTCRAGRPACLVGLAFAAGPLRASFGCLGVGLPACGAPPPRFAWAPFGKPGGRPAAPLPASRHCPPSVGLTSVRLSPPPRHGHSAALRVHAASGFDSLRSLHAATAAWRSLSDPA